MHTNINRWYKVILQYLMQSDIHMMLHAIHNTGKGILLFNALYNAIFKDTTYHFQL
jgi:hypothetical protein